MTRRKKQIYVLLMVGSAIAMFADRMTLKSPLDPAAASALTIETARPTSAAGTVVPPELMVPELPFPRELPSFEVSDLRDIFQPPHLSAGATPQQASQPADSENVLRAGALSRDLFAARHSLKAVLLDDGLKIAVIGDYFLRPGDELDGCMLNNIDADEVTFECHDGDITLQFSPENTLQRP